MKTKSFLLGAAALMLAASCSNDEVVNVAPQSGAIGFSSFVNNSTRTDYGTGEGESTLDALKVYGVRSEGGLTVPECVFAGQEVKNSGSAWTYSPLRYWVSTSNYTFAAVAPAGVIVDELAEGASLAAGQVFVHQTNATSNGGVSTIDFVNNGEVDLLFDKPDDMTNVSASEDAVDLDLKHLLSRVRFEFVNEMDDDYTIEVTGLKIYGLAVNGEYAISTSSWTVKEEVQDFDFTMGEAFLGKQKSTSKNIIPVGTSQAYKASFKINVYDKATGSLLSEKTLDHEVTLPGIDFVKGNSYTFKASVNSENIEPDPEHPVLHPITFSATVRDWNEEEGGEILPQPENK